MRAGLAVAALLLNSALITLAQDPALSRRVEEADCHCKCIVKQPGPEDTRPRAGKLWPEDLYPLERSGPGSKCKCYCEVDQCEAKSKQTAGRTKMLVSDLTTLQALAADLQEIFDKAETKRLNSYSAKLNSQLKKLEKRVERNVSSVSVLLKEAFEKLVQHRHIYQNLSSTMRAVKKELSKFNSQLRKQQPLPQERKVKVTVKLNIGEAPSLKANISKDGAPKEWPDPQPTIAQKPTTRPHPPTARPGVFSSEAVTGKPSDDNGNMIREDGCDGTLVMIRDPETHSSYGRAEGAWMKDSVVNQERVYVANYFFGTTLIEFRNLEHFKLGRWSNTYKLPYSWIGTGHAVYNGSFYYNKAYTRNIIRYDLRQRTATSWSSLDDLVTQSATLSAWKGYSEVDFTVDESGLWVAYFSNDFGYLPEEVLVLSRLDPIDLSARKETTWKTQLRRSSYGNYFLICGVFYAMNLQKEKEGIVTYAFDTHTGFESNPGLTIQSNYSYLTQIDYNPIDKLLYAWDNGFQVTYNVIFAY
ncbi:olfactomedin-like protein 2A [Heptranchias perlo]|uniref:olfactomedin-like protein 2A n=1 Tax=Heptranchias perlo TaxID=212740 RepID=UPI00355955BE